MAADTDALLLDIKAEHGHRRRCVVSSIFVVVDLPAVRPENANRVLPP